MSTPRIFMALVIVACMAGIGYAVGQFYPVMGGMLEHLCQPFSPCRNSAALKHAVVGGVLGLVISALAQPGNERKDP